MKTTNSAALRRRLLISLARGGEWPFEQTDGLAKGVRLARLVSLWAQGALKGKLCLGEDHGLQAIEVDWNALFLGQ